MRLSLLAVALAALWALASAQQSYKGEACPWYQIDTNNFNATAFLPLFNFPACKQYNKEACCKMPYATRVSARTDPISTALWDQIDIDSASLECRRLIDLLACLPCSPFSDTVATVNQYSTTVRVCSSFCGLMYELCGSAEVVNSTETVADFYSSSTGFCVSLLGLAEWHVDVRTLEDDTCFTDKPECTRADYIGEYTPCNNNGTRSVFFRKAENTRCEAGVPKPAPIYGLPCHIGCNAGQYLPIGQKACKACPAGTFSVGGGKRVESFSEWPTEWDVETYCTADGSATPMVHCGWYSTDDNDTLVSGHVNDSQSSHIEIRALFVRDGTVRFSYKVDAEPRYDGLTFYVDNVVKMNLTSNTNGFQLFSVDVRAGYHRFKWSYSKDFAIAEGEDQAALSMIEFEGTAWGDDECTPCPLGHYSRVGAVDCIPCRANTFANVTGSASCEECPEGTYSYEESDECTPKPPCTTDDYASFVTLCRNNARVRSFHWTEPQICDPTLPESVLLPANQTIACAPCPAGTVAQNSLCVACPEGYARAQNETRCNVCPAGSAAIKSQEFNTWDVLNTDYFVTFCEGECGTNGWRPLSEYIDSGVGHGHSVSSILSLYVTLSVKGTLTFNATLLCVACSLEVEDVGYSAWSYNPGFHGVSTLELPAGVHQVLFKFEKYDPHRVNRNERAIIYNIAVVGTTTGGARTCTQCAAGTAAPEQSSMCRNCTAGQYSPAGAGQCLPCPVNTFSETPGTAECYKCGANAVIQTPAGSTECLFDCKYNNALYNYDLSALASTLDMWGPIYDGRDHAYLFNPCSVNHQNHSCFDAKGDPIKTFVCQVTNVGLGMDLGSVIGYYPLPAGAGANDGLIVSYTHGSQGCAASSPDRKPRFRSTNITFLCDAEAGVGLPGFPEESAPCQYQFEWHSLYACPVCSTRDYSYFLTNCEPSTNTRRKIYHWIDNPKRCHDGPALPQDETVECSSASQVPCPAGYYLPTGATQCVAAEPGYYTTGPAEIWSRWNAEQLGKSNASPWNTSCSGEGCTGWSVTADGLVKSGTGFSVLSATITWERGRSGSVIFTYKYGHSNRSDFDVLFNGQHKWDLEKDPIKSTSDNAGEWNTVLIANVIGTQEIAFVFNSANAGDFVILQSVAFDNTRPNVGFSSPCPAGSFASQQAATGCYQCPANSRSSGAASNCTACDANEYSTAGSAECLPRPTCTLSDYVLTYSACVDGKRNATYSLLEPRICAGGVRTPAALKGIECEPCPTGTIGITGACSPCDQGKYYDTASHSCQSVPASYVSVPVLTHFGVGDAYTLPEGWNTSCTGSCSSSWRARGDFVDSGVSLDHEVDSKLSYFFAMTGTGSLTFDYELSPESPAGTSLVVIVDGVSTDLPPHLGPVVGKRVTVSAFATRIDFLHHIMPGGPPAVIGNVTLSGVVGGYNLRPVPCPAGTQNPTGKFAVCTECLPGTFRPEGTSAACVQCPANTFAPGLGAVSCINCGVGTTAPAGSKSCLPVDNKCQFTSQATNTTYDLSWFRRGITVSNLETMHFTICEPTLSCGEGPFTYGCLSQVGGAVNIGRRLNFIDSGSIGVFALKFDLGDMCNGREISATISFRCANSTRQPYLDVLPTAACTSDYKLSWNTTAACRICRPADYELAYTPCINSVRKLEQVLRPNLLCSGPNRLPEREEECVEEVSVKPWYLLVAVALLVALVIAIVFVLMKNRSLQHRYTQLSGVSARNANFGAPETAEPLTDTPTGPSNGTKESEVDDL